MRSQLKLINVLTHQFVAVNALVDTGAMFMYTSEALVLGNEPLMGALPMEAMDLVLEPRTQQVAVNPPHPNVPVVFAKGNRL